MTSSWKGPSFLKVLDQTLTDPQAKERTTVFFNLKTDNESGFSQGQLHPFLAYTLSPQEKCWHSHLQGPAPSLCPGQ